ncbi:MAG: NAD(P)-dependent oxidoreductase [Selenomonadaceae bacterium]|nr:NAD(P)-dependent oxidoreductase [Selenomonadaceae bacterium]
MKALVGYTGFVGSNLDAEEKFEGRYNSKNISEAFGTSPDLLIYAGVPAAKYLANSAPEKDFEIILQAQENIKKISPKKLVLISTIDVFKNPIEVDEDADIDTENLQAYGKNRRHLEVWVQKNFSDALIVRLPGLFGKNIKKNFIYDFIHKIPFRLTEKLFSQLCEKESELKNFYSLQDNGFYQCKNLIDDEEKVLKKIFEKLDFSALNFTDSRSVYQFYPLSRLWNDIEIALKNDLKILHLATEPVQVGELYSYLTGKNFVNELANSPANYDFRTKFAKSFGGQSNYLMDKNSVMKSIAEFIKI